MRSLALLLGLSFIAAPPIAMARPACSKVMLDSRSAYEPLRFLDSQLQIVLNRIETQSKYKNDGIIRDRTLQIRARRDALMQVFYEEGWIEASPTTFLMFDKLIMAKTLEHYLGKNFTHFHPPTQGVKEFLTKHRFVDSTGKVTVSRKQMEAALKQDFPEGYIAKPPVGWSSSGRSFFKDPNEIIDLLMNGNSDLYRPQDIKTPFQSDRVSSGVASGERFMLMGLINGTSGTSKDTAFGDSNEFRVHAFYGKVLKDATETRWYTPGAQSKIKVVNDFVQDLLNKMPIGFSRRMGYSFDVFVTAQGRLQLIEINTNRGERTNWSGFLRIPGTIGAYARHMRDTYNWKIEGVEGWMFYNGYAHVIPHVKHELLEWLKDANTPGLETQALAGFRKLHQDYLDQPLAMIKVSKAEHDRLMASPDFAAVIRFGEKMHEKLDPVQRVGDKAWIEFEAWINGLEH